MPGAWNWAKMASDFDSNPKAILAGRAGRELFLFLLRRNAYEGCNGVVVVQRPVASHMLQMDLDELEGAIEAATAAGLITVKDGEFHLVGWSQEWAPPLSSTERSRRFREKQREGVPKGRRGRKEKEKEKENIKADSTALLATCDVVIAELNRLAGRTFRPRVDSNKQLIRARLAEGYTEDDLVAVVAAKVKEWKGTDFEKYLRPSTLFGKEKFSNYIGAAQKAPQSEARKAFG